MDEEEGRWREASRQTAMRVRIMREEFDREMPPPARYDIPPIPMSWFDRWSVPLGIVAAILVGAVVGLIASLPIQPRPIEVHVVQDQVKP
jgi:hypothetical protein